MGGNSSAPQHWLCNLWVPTACHPRVSTVPCFLPRSSWFPMVPGVDRGTVPQWWIGKKHLSSNWDSENLGSQSPREWWQWITGKRGNVWLQDLPNWNRWYEFKRQKFWSGIMFYSFVIFDVACFLTLWELRITKEDLKNLHCWFYVMLVNYQSLKLLNYFT